IISSSTDPIILYDVDVEDAFSSTKIPNYTSALPNYSPALPGNTISDTSKDPYEDQLVPIVVSPFDNDLYMKVMQAYYATNELPIPPPPAPITSPLSLVTSTQEMIIKDIQVRHRSDIRSLLEAIRKLKNNKNVDRMAPKRTSTSTAPTMTQATIRKLVADSVATALEAQAVNMANANNTNRNIEQR
nr:hypothetical protein [Tanacetum cinerariifolium]